VTVGGAVKYRITTMCLYYILVVIFENTPLIYSPNFSLICNLFSAVLSEILYASEETLDPSNKSKLITRILTGVSPYEQIFKERIQLVNLVRLFS